MGGNLWLWKFKEENRENGRMQDTQSPTKE